MKHILHFILLLGFINTTAQTVNTVYDTIRFADATYYEGQQIILGTGTLASKEFTHIMTGKNIDSLIPLPASYANQMVTIEMVYQNNFGFVIVASPPRNNMKSGYILIRVEHALLSKELMRPKKLPEETLVNLVTL